MICSVYISCHLLIKMRQLGAIIKEAIIMKERTKEIDDQQIVTIDKVFMGFLLGIVAILSLWFISGLFFVILK